RRLPGGGPLRGGGLPDRRRPPRPRLRRPRPADARPRRRVRARPADDAPPGRRGRLRLPASRPDRAHPGPAPRAAARARTLPVTSGAGPTAPLDAGNLVNVLRPPRPHPTAPRPVVATAAAAACDSYRRNFGECP